MIVFRSDTFRSHSDTDDRYRHQQLALQFMWYSDRSLGGVVNPCGNQISTTEYRYVVRMRVFEYECHIHSTVASSICVLVTVYTK